MSSTPGDLAERRRSSAAHVRAILDNTLDAVVAMDADAVIRFWNPRAEETFGWERTEAVGRRLVELVVDEADRERLQADLERLASADGASALRLEVTGRRRDSSAFPLEITVTRIPEDPDYRFKRLRPRHHRAQAPRARAGAAAVGGGARREQRSRVPVKTSPSTFQSWDAATPWGWTTVGGAAKTGEAA